MSVIKKQIEFLVGEIMKICTTDIQKPWLRHDKWAKDEIRTLLQFHRPSVTREEIDEIVELVGEFDVRDNGYENIKIWFKSRGIDFKEE